MHTIPKSIKPGFTSLETIVCAVIVACLALCLTTALSKTREQGRSAVCLSNLRQWGIALHGYTGDHGGMLPRRGQGVQLLQVIDRPEDWFNALPPYLGELPYRELAERSSQPRPGAKSNFVCPSAKTDASVSHFLCYGMNMHLSRWDSPEPSRMANLGRTDNLVFMADSPGGYASTVPSASRYSVPARHGGLANVLFIDGHAESFDGKYLGCGTGGKITGNVRWKVNESDPWNPR